MDDFPRSAHDPADRPARQPAPRDGQDRDLPHHDAGDPWYAHLDPRHPVHGGARGAPARTAVHEASRRHCRDLQEAVGRLHRDHAERLARWGARLAAVLPGGGRLLVAGNGGSAAQAQHLTAELVGRYRQERSAYSAVSLHAETSSVTAIGNDYGFEQVYARQVAAHGRPGDVLLLLSTSGRSTNLIAAAATARSAGVRVWALTGPAPNPLADAAHEALCVDAGSTATVQEVHLVAVHLLCECFDAAVEAAAPEAAPTRFASGLWRVS
ncbi:SIS domain-containing protein [Streptomyces sp. CC53]|uniref:D-sedoheptulose-7-phosphate isomerase n=1 Tax=Streptomyces sp. CC53 TaxID=1906740 RepID=UPI000AF6B161|nr:SIS domain-containing protein [Streptomyces sp. CC53]